MSERLLDPHDWLYDAIIDGRQVVKCRRCDKVESYRLSGYKPQPPLSECNPKAPAPTAPSGPDAETLAETVREALVTMHPSMVDRVGAAHTALSGLVALVEQRERDVAQIANKPGGVIRRYGWISKREADEVRQRAEEAEARLARCRQALERIAAHPHVGILVNIARRALAASAPGTDEQ